MEALLDPVTFRKRLRAASWDCPWRLVSWVVLVAVVAAWGVFLRPQVLGGPATYLVVSGHSMEPRLHSGDLVIALREPTYHRGDVIAYHIPKNQAGAGALIIHRIVGGSAQDGYITRGDNRDYRDPWRPKRSDIAGEMKLRAPHLGMLPIYAHTLVGMALIAALVGFFVLRGGGTDDDADGEGPPGLPEDPHLTQHLLFARAPNGYELLERPGEPPTVGAVVDDGEQFYRVSKLGRSPLPFDSRQCAYVEPA
jgi:signal peptidase I